MMNGDGALQPPEEGPGDVFLLLSGANVSSSLADEGASAAAGPGSGPAAAAPGGGAWGSSSYSNQVDQWNATFNLTTEEILQMMLGPKQVAMSVLVPITVIYVIMFMTGVVGNLAVCFVIIKNRSMHTATNYYLFSLALSDLIILMLGLPNELAGFWHQYPYLQGEIFCKFRSYVSELASYSSVLTIVSFSVERYLAICHPLHVFEMGDFQRVLRVLCVDWAIAGVAAIPYLLFTTINYVDYPLGSGNYLEDSAFCALLDHNISPKGYPMHELSTILFFLIPVAILLFLYTAMAITLNGSIRKSSVTQEGAGSAVHGERQLTSSRKQIIRMLAVVVIAFFVCWAPFHAQRLGYVYFKESSVFRTINEYLMYISGITYYVSSTINPILYNVMSAKYRMAFKRTLCGLQNNTHEGHGLCYTQPTPGVRGRLSTWDSAGEQASLNSQPANSHPGRRATRAAMQRRTSSDSVILPLGPPYYVKNGLGGSERRHTRKKDALQTVDEIAEENVSFFGRITNKKRAEKSGSNCNGNTHNGQAEEHQQFL